VELPGKEPAEILVVNEEGQPRKLPGNPRASLLLTLASGKTTMLCGPAVQLYETDLEGVDDYSDDD